MAIETLKQSVDVCNKFRRKNTIGESLGKMVKKVDYNCFTKGEWATFVSGGWWSSVPFYRTLSKSITSDHTHRLMECANLCVCTTTHNTHNHRYNIGNVIMESILYSSRVEYIVYYIEHCPLLMTTHIAQWSVTCVCKILMESLATFSCCSQRRSTLSCVTLSVCCCVLCSPSWRTRRSSASWRAAWRSELVISRTSKSGKVAMYSCLLVTYWYLIGLPPVNFENGCLLGSRRKLRFREKVSELILKQIF